jgi:hypothetical protein
MNVKEILQFIKTTFENITIGAVKTLKDHEYVVKLKSNRVEITNPLKLPKVFKTKEINPINNKQDIENQTKQLVKFLENQIDKLEKAMLDISKKDSVKITNLKDIPEAPKEIKVVNPQRVVSISNFFEIQKEIGKLKKAVEALKLDPKIIIPDIKIPNIRIPAIKQPEIKNEIILDKLEKLIGINPKEYVPVRLSDGEKFYEALKEIETIVSGGGGGKYAFQDTKGERTYGLTNILRQLMVVSEDRWGLNNSEKVGSITYTGEEDVDGNWIVRRITKAGSSISMAYATKKNNSNINTYTYAWGHRASLVYGRFSVAFKLD